MPPANQEPAVATQERTQTRTKQQPPWNVILLDDDFHTYEYVIRMMQSVFGHTLESAFRIAVQVDSTGRAVCATVHKELAELKQEQIHAFGRDPLMSTSAGSMSATIEPCTGGDDDEAGGDKA